MINFIQKFTALSIFAIFLNGCDNLDNTSQTTPYDPIDARAIIMTVSGDYSSSAVSVITGDNNRVAYNELISSTDSDRTLNTFNDDIYIIERFTGNNIAKFSLDDITTPEWQYSTQDSPTFPKSSNPYQIVFLNDTKAYILRYGSNYVWVIDPSATSSEDFLISQIDLSAYADADGYAEIAMGLIENGNLYIAIQRLENYAPINTSYVAIIDTVSDIEIDANISGDSLKGIPLTIRNPTNSMQYLADTNSIYVQAAGDFYNATNHTGGIEKIDLTDYSTTLIIDDGIAASHPNEKISAMTIISPTLGYYISYAGWKNTSLYTFNPTTGAEAQTSIASLLSGDFSDVTVDANGLVWLSDAGNATVQVIDPLTDTLVDSIYTALPPQKISFVNQ